MPKDFDMCVAGGGKVITKQMGKTKYMHLCKDKSGAWHQGEMKKYKKIMGKGKKSMMGQ